MTIENYIKGERYGKKAHDFEKGAMSDPFLQDAIDGYDLEDDRPAYYLKKLQKQVKKRTKKNFFYLQLLGIAVCVLIIIVLSIFFFISDNNKSIFPEDGMTYVVPHTTDSVSLHNMIDSLTASRSTQDVTNTTTLSEDKEIETYERQARPSVVREDPAIQQMSRRRYEEEQQYFPYQRQDVSYNYTLSESETQRFLSRSNDKDISEVKAANNNVNLTSKPTGGEQAYNDYINKNRNTATNDVSERQHGKVILLFKVNTNGRPVDISVLRSLNQTADKEAIRLLQNGPDWTAGDKNAYLEVEF